MSYLTHLKCHRCGDEFPPGPYFVGCPSCPPDRPSNLYCVYDYEAVARAWAYVAEAIRRAPGYGTGHGPLNHAWPLEGRA